MGASPKGDRTHAGLAGATPKVLGGAELISHPQIGAVPWAGLDWEALVGTGSTGRAAKAKHRSRRWQRALRVKSPEISTSSGTKIPLFCTRMPAAPNLPPATEAGCLLVILHHLFSLADRKKCRQKTNVSYAGWHIKCCFNCILFGNKKIEAAMNPPDMPPLPPI